MFGPKKIEIASVQDVQAISELSAESWSNNEPGFQVDEIKTLDDLYIVFNAVRSAAPTDEAKSKEFSIAVPRPSDGIESSQKQELGFIHVDGLGEGMSAHHNVTGTFPVRMGVFTPEDRKTRLHGFVISSDIWPILSTKNLRLGETKPGRLTIFSRGGYPWLKPTMHHFARPNSTGNEFARYSQARNGNTKNVDKMALQALARIRLLAEAS